MVNGVEVEWRNGDLYGVVGVVAVLYVVVGQFDVNFHFVSGGVGGALDGDYVASFFCFAFEVVDLLA